MKFQPSKAIREESYAQSLATFLGDQIPRNEFSRDSDPPDFAVGSTSLEVTELYQRDARDRAERRPDGTEVPFRQQYESLTGDIARRAQHRAADQLLLPAQYSVHFAPQLELPSKAIDSLVIAIVAAVSEHLANTDTSTVRGSTYVSYDRLPPHVVAIGIRWSPSFKAPKWGVNDAGFLPPLDPTRVAATIRRKAEDLPRYANRFAAHWLLVALPDFRISGAFDLDGLDLRSVTVAPFHRAFLLIASNARIVDIGV